MPLLYAQLVRDRKVPSWQLLNTAYNNCQQWIAGEQANCPHVTSDLLGLLSFKDRAQHLHTRVYLHLISMNSRNPLRSILNCKGWYPKSNHYLPVHNYHPLLYQFVNPTSAFNKFLPTLQDTPIANIRQNVLDELVLQNYNKIHAISSHLPKLLHITMFADRVPKLHGDVVLTAPAGDQQSFLAWRPGIWGWGRKCVCGTRFDRGHTRCMPSPFISLNNLQQRLYKTNHRLLDDDIK